MHYLFISSHTRAASAYSELSLCSQPCDKSLLRAGCWPLLGEHNQSKKIVGLIVVSGDFLSSGCVLSTLGHLWHKRLEQPCLHELSICVNDTCTCTAYHFSIHSFRYIHMCMNVHIQQKPLSSNPEKTAALIHIQAPRHLEAALLIRDQRRREWSDRVCGWKRQSVEDKAGERERSSPV